MTRNRFVYVLTLLIANACIDPYAIKSVGFEGQLVVDGFISTDFKQHQVKISRTSPVTKGRFLPETNAQVTLQVGNAPIKLIEAKPGIYQTPPLRGVVGVNYSLSIVLSNGAQYRSDEVKLRDNPGIQNVYAAYAPAIVELGNAPGVQIFVDAEDPTNANKFFRWEYIETWEVQTPFESNFVWTGTRVEFRSPPVSTCYPSDTSSNVVVYSTIGQSSPKVTRKLIRAIDALDQALGIRYSILVRQYTLSDQGYKYWETIRKVNQTQGSLYDTQPGVVRGNLISLSNDKEVVLGFFDACAVAEMRQFFRPQDFRDAGFVATEFYRYCSFITALQVSDSQIGNFLASPSGRGLEIVGTVGFGPTTIFLMPRSCANCTDIGTNIKPPFW